MPILGNVLIEAGADHISLTTTNLDIGIRCRITAEVSNEGSITLPVRKLATIVKELPQQEVFFELASTTKQKSPPVVRFLRLWELVQMSFHRYRPSKISMSLSWSKMI